MAATLKLVQCITRTELLEGYNKPWWMGLEYCPRHLDVSYWYPIPLHLIVRGWRRVRDWWSRVLVYPKTHMTYQDWKDLAEKRQETIYKLRMEKLESRSGGGAK